jgi:hypothetical protein
MNEVAVVAAFFLLMGVAGSSDGAGTPRAGRWQKPSEPRGVGRQELFSFLTTQPEALSFATSPDRRFLDPLVAPPLQSQQLLA